MTQATISEPRRHRPEPDFAAFLRAQALVDAGAIDRARHGAEQSGIRFAAALVHLGIMGDDACRDALAGFCGVATIKDGGLILDPRFQDRLPLGFLRDNHLLPVAGDGDGVVLAMADPTDAQAAKAVALSLGGPVRIKAASRAAIDRAIEGLAGLAAGETRLIERQAEFAAGHGADLTRLRELASEAPVIRRVNQLLRDAVERRASDIHLEPLGHGLRPRLRIDGVLVACDPIPVTEAAPLLSRLKLLAGMDIAESRLPQDGRIGTNVHGRAIDLRVATLPSLNGETMVIRVLDPVAAADMRLSGLGFDDRALADLRALIAAPNGMVLVTGPTGSGKTTTLYAALRELNQPATKIVTVEDPIEYELKGVVQIQVRPDIGLHFATILRAALRHNPDILLVGEIRDLETAHIAVEAALTGHQVLATLHANGAAASIARLSDLGLDEYLVSATLRGAMSQRLIRKLCRACARPLSVGADLVGRYLPGLALAGEVTLYEPVGCGECQGSGFSGRTAIHELLLVDAPIRAMIHRRAPIAEIEAAARRNGFVSLREQGVFLALSGTTALAEVLRVTEGD